MESQFGYCPFAWMYCSSQTKGTDETNLWKNINSFHATGLFPYSMKTAENLLFFLFSGIIERDQWHKMG